MRLPAPHASPSPAGGGGHRRRIFGAGGGWGALLAALPLLAACAPRTLGGRFEAPKPALAALPTPSPSPTPAAALPQTRPLDEGKPVKIKAKRLRYDDQAKETRFSGDVVATQESATLRADELATRTQGRSALAKGNVRLEDPVRRVRASASEAEYTDSLGEAWLRGGVAVNSQDPYGVSVTVTGASAHYLAASQRAEVEGGVRIHRGSLTATAGSAVLEGGEGRVRLAGGVDADLGGNRARAERAAVGGKEKKLELEGAVRARFVPSQVREAVEHPERVR